MLFILHTVPVAFSADSKLVRDSVLLLPETLRLCLLEAKSAKFLLLSESCFNTSGG